MSLLEVLIAFVIAALSLGVLVPGSGDGLTSARVGAHEQEALSLAQSRLQAASVSLQAGRQDGDDGPFHWTTSVAPSAFGQPGLVLYAVGVTISWTFDGGQHAVSLATQRLAEAAEPP